MILLIDNYDSFTYNVKQYIEELGGRCEVFRNDVVDVAKMQSMHPSHIVISPGPGDPNSAGITLEAIRVFSGKVPILGICLGHQAIGQAFGGRVIRAPKPKHGKISSITHFSLGMFSGVPSPMNVARYHSLIVERSTLPDCLEITAESDDGLIMALRHREYDVQGVQFHPESIATENGHALLRNFLGAER
jgi:anthranilate synthase/aminodeoxychorismate synthase-like glutamine amidotransferase